MDRKLIGLRFKSLRIKKGFDTQVELIEDFKNVTGIELKKSAISMYESGQRLPEHELLLSLADYYEVTTDYMYGRSDVEINVVKNTMKNLALLIDKLSEEDRKNALKYLEFLNLGEKV